jgi:ElaB/YqjD/DUF883 family membrane-anchored ribosome-binding protein
MAAKEKIYDQFLKWKDSAQERAEEAKAGVEDHVASHPWQTIGISAAAGILLGILLARRRQ